jgi:hypothetical protein
LSNRKKDVKNRRFFLLHRPEWKRDFFERKKHLRDTKGLTQDSEKDSRKREREVKTLWGAYASVVVLRSLSLSLDTVFTFLLL